MIWTKRKKKEPLPWYRARNYKGNLTEEEKRELDSFRHREANGGQHPAASFSDLPEEVQSYISKLHIENYDHIQERLVGRCFVASGIGLLLLASYYGWIPKQNDSVLIFLYGVALLIGPWIYYVIKWRKNADQFWHESREGIRSEWELEYIVNKKMKKRSKASAEDSATHPTLLNRLLANKRKR